MFGVEWCVLGTRVARSEPSEHSAGSQPAGLHGGHQETWGDLLLNPKAAQLFLDLGWVFSIYWVIEDNPRNKMGETAMMKNWA